MFYIYVLKSKIYKKHYIGQTKDLKTRIKFHNSQQARWTKRYQPCLIVYYETVYTRSDAMKREKELKKMKDIESFLDKQAGVTQLVESQPSKLLVASSSLVSRSE